MAWFAVLSCGFGQQKPADIGPSLNQSAVSSAIAEIKRRHKTFTFVRIRYSGGGRWRGNVWATDYPDSDANFSTRFATTTGLPSDPKGKVMTLLDPELKQFPFIYMVEPGHLRLADQEVVALRDYLLGGGFLMADDFWGEAEWESFAAELKRVFPDLSPAEIPLNHPLFHCYYDIREKPQIPNVALGTASQYTGITWERADARQPHYRGLFNPKGRVMAVFCHNTDLGDGWEREGDNDYYFREFSRKKAYPLGINIIIYALSQ